MTLTSEVPLAKAKNSRNSVHEVIQHDADAAAVLDLVPRLDWSEMNVFDHFVQFYETDMFLLNSMIKFISAGLSAGDACVVVATKEHLEGVNERLQAFGLDVEATTASGQYVALDAEETLSKFMVKGSPEPGQFAEVLGSVIAQAANGQRRVRVFGEMVALLWAEGNHDAALRMEKLWNDLRKTHSFLLFCAYPINGFSGEGLAKPLSDICAEHLNAIPAESYNALDNPDDRLHAIIELQRKAKSLEAEVTQRKQSEELSSHLAAIVESSDDAIVSKSIEGIILSWNKGAERIFGYTAEEVIGKSILILIPPDRTDEESDILNKLRRGERIDHFETVRVAKDGHPVDISLTVSPVKNRSGEIIAASKIARDITESKQIRERLREQAEIIESINRLGQSLSAELNLENVVQMVSDSAAEITGARFGAFFYNVTSNDGESYLLYTLSGTPREAFTHFPMLRNTDLFGPTFCREGTIRIDDVKKDPRYGKNSPYYGMSSGHLSVTSYLAVPVVSRSGEALGGLFLGHPDAGVFTERHERIVEGLAAQAAIAMDNARLYELSQRERDKAESANRMKDEFLATVSHELRTPLNAIIGWSHMLRGGRLDEATVARALETIERSARAQAQLIEDILDVSRVITGKLRLNIGPVDVTLVINAAIDSMQLAAQSKGIQLEVTLDPSARHISGDHSRLQQIVWNLLSNAIKFTPSGGRVEVRLERAGHYVQIGVSDTGQGIKPDFLPFIFDRFRQADGSSTRRQGGIGLGLAIVRHLVELHGGTVHVDSPGEGCGATFTIKFPLAVANERTKGFIRDASLWPNEDANSYSEPLPLLDNVKILLVDDDQDTLQVLTVMLTEHRAKVQAATSVAEALEVYQWYKPDLLVTDLAMPGEDGYSLISKVRALEVGSGRQMPAIALTAYVRVEDHTQALSAGFNMFVPKPVEPNELITAIANLANLKTTK